LHRDGKATLARVSPRRNYGPKFDQAFEVLAGRLERLEGRLEVRLGLGRPWSRTSASSPAGRHHGRTRSELSIGRHETPASRLARTSSRTKLSRTRLRTAPERPRVHPFALADRGIAQTVLAPDPGAGDQLRQRLPPKAPHPCTVSDRLRGVGQALIASRTRAKGANRGGEGAQARLTNC
jgi:hypothetical protein